jgi:hypothetical protein
MGDRWRNAHRVIGGALVLTFLATGAYLRMNFPGLYGSNETVRYLYRANHAYILYVGLLNLALGIYFVADAQRWRRALQRMGSALVLAAAALLIWAFFVEPPRAVPERPRTTFGAIAALSGTLLHLVGGSRRDSVNI